jgi:hypothetical protein
MPSQSSSEILLVGLLAPIVVLLALSLYRRREGVRYFLRRVIVSEIVYVISALYLIKQHIAPVIALLFGILAGVAAERLLIKTRSRYIPAAEKRKAIARYEKKAGRRYDPRQDEFDHEIAFSRGGSSTADNLRIRSRAENRRKGRKSPWWDLLGR